MISRIVEDWLLHNYGSDPAIIKWLLSPTEFSVRVKLLNLSQQISRKNIAGLFCAFRYFFACPPIGCPLLHSCFFFFPALSSPFHLFHEVRGRGVVYVYLWHTSWLASEVTRWEHSEQRCHHGIVATLCTTSQLECSLPLACGVAGVLNWTNVLEVLALWGSLPGVPILLGPVSMGFHAKSKEVFALNIQQSLFPPRVLQLKCAEAAADSQQCSLF